MLNVHELERRWLRYKIKTFLLPIALSLLLLVVISGAILWIPTIGNSEKPEASQVALTETPTQANNDTSVPSTVTTPATVPSTPIIPKQPTTAETANDQPTVSSSNLQEITAPLAIHPSMEFIRDIEEEVMPYYETESVPPAYAQVAPSTMAQNQQPHPTAYFQKQEEPIESNNQEVSEPAQISITQESADDLNDVIKRFKVNKKPALSLFIARKYYEHEEYKSAYDYALQTNELDSNIEESWLIFTKSLVKLGHKEQAIKTLKTYINHSRSHQAKVLLDSIKQGKFQ